jgi:stage IV sporulation protein FB
MGAQIVPLCRYKRYVIRPAWQLIKWRDVPIVLDWTVLLGLPWFYFRDRDLVDMAMAFVAFFSLLLAHELGHASVARWRRVRVLEIRLFILHGYCEHEQPEKRSDGIWIAWGGVAAQFVVLIVACGVSALLESQYYGWYLLAEPMLRILIPANILIILLNLLPLPGLDGAKAWQVLPIAWKSWTRDRSLRREAKAVTSDIIEQLKKRR